MENINKDILTRISFECKHSIEQKKQAIVDANNKDLERLKDIYKNEKRTPEIIESEINFFKSLFFENNINNINEYVSIINQNHFQRFDKEIIKQIRWAFEEKKNNTIYKKYCLICNPYPLSQKPYLLRYYKYYEFLLSQKKITEKAKNDTIKFDINTENENIKPDFFSKEQFDNFIILNKYYSTRQNKILSKYRNIFQYLKAYCSFEYTNKELYTNYIKSNFLQDFSIISDKSIQREYQRMENLIKEKTSTEKH